jgi:hypothetical protein
MRTKLSLLLSLISVLSFAQDAKVSGINSFLLKNSGTILDKNKDVDGYYFFYEMDKLKKGNREFAIQLLDKNLNEVAKKTYVDNKNTTLKKASFNNQAMMFAMANYSEKKIELLVFDSQANQNNKITLPFEKKEMDYMGFIDQRNGGNFDFLYPVENKGFIFNKVEENKKIGYSLKYYPTDGGTTWEYNSEKESKEILFINPIVVNDKILVALESAVPGPLSRKLTLRTKIIDVNTGKLIFEIENSRAVKPRMINNAFIEGDNIVLVGEYYKDGDNVLSDKSLGLFTQVLDKSGNTIKESFISWKDDVTKVAKTSKSFIEDKGYVFFHNIVKTKSGDYYAIGEYYKKTVSAAGIGMTILTRGQSSTTQITITDAVIFKFNSEFKLLDIKDFSKTKSRAPSLSDFASPQLNAFALKAYGAFDYEYTQLDKANDRFYACFVDYEKIEGSSNKNAFKTIIYDEGTFSEDKIYLKDGKKEFKVLPAKVGNVMLLEYDKKEKTINVHLEKLNIN